MMSEVTLRSERTYGVAIHMTLLDSGPPTVGKNCLICHDCWILEPSLKLVYIHVYFHDPATVSIKDDT